MSLKKVKVDNVNAGIQVGAEELDENNALINPVPGCVDTAACNYSSNATEDDGSCVYANQSCVDLSSEDYGNEALLGGLECVMEPLSVCPGCYVNDNGNDYGVPQYTNTTGGQGNEWCEFCDDPAADNYQAEYINDSTRVAKRSMCLYTACVNPDTGVPCCNQVFPEEGMMDNYTHDNSMCVYAHAGCVCSGETAVADSAGGYCGDCMEVQPYASSAVYFQPGLADGYCECGDVKRDGYCDCTGNETSSNCECGSSTPIDNTYCDCDATEYKSPICGCEGSVRGTTLPTTGIYARVSIVDADGNTLEVYGDPSAACDCDGAVMPTAYFKDLNGDGYGHPSYGVAYVCPDHLPSGVVDLTPVSVPGSGVAGGWSKSESPCLDDAKDCAGVCPSEFQATYGESYGAGKNNCDQCIPPSQQIPGWVENCCAADVDPDCPICSDDFDNNIVGGLSYDKDLTDSVNDGQFYIAYKPNAESGLSSSAYVTCDCSTSAGKNYYEDDLENNVSSIDTCDVCAKSSDQFMYAGLETHLNRSGAPLGQLIVKKVDYFDENADLYCNCGYALLNQPIADDQCCGGKIKACDGNCYDPAFTGGQVDCNGNCGGNHVETKCCGCVDITLPENQDCNRDCCGELDCHGACDGDAVEDECKVCGGNNSTCTGCVDPNAENYDAAATRDCVTCCVYAKPTLTQLVIQNLQADATGTQVSPENFLQPFAFAQDDDYWGATDISAVDQEIINNYFANISGVQLTDRNSNLATSFGWDYSEVDSSGFTDAEGNTIYKTIYRPPLVNPRVQIISPTNTTLVCERPQDNALVGYNVRNAEQELLLSKFYFYGTGISDVAELNNQIYSTSSTDYATVNQISYFFAIDSSLKFDSTSIELLFQDAGSNIKEIKKLTGANAGEYLKSNYQNNNPWAGNAGTLNNFETGVAETVTTAQGDIPIYHAYEVVVAEYAEFTVDLTAIPGLLSPPPVLGCTDANACNYNNSATEDDGSCYFAEAGKYCDGTDIPVYGCIDSSAVNYNPSANTPDPAAPCEYEGCTDPTASNYDSTATIDNGTCQYPLPCDGLPQSPICCQSGFTNSSSNFTSINGIAVANDECEVCSAEVCLETVYICCDETAENTFVGEFDPDRMQCSSATCQYPSVVTPSNVHSTSKIVDITSLTQEQLNDLKWVVYDASGTVVSESKFINISSATSGDTGGLEIDTIVNIESNQGCLWFLPFGYEQNSIWDNVQFEIKYSGELIHQLYGKNTPAVKDNPSLPNDKNYSSSVENGSALITQYGDCRLGCDKSEDVLVTQYCEVSVDLKGGNLVNLFLNVTTEQSNGDFSQSYVEIINLNTGQVISNITGMTSGSEYDATFTLSETTPIGIKAYNNNQYTLTYKVTTEEGNIITNKTIK
jgi:hypothetical protein